MWRGITSLIGIGATALGAAYIAKKEKDYTEKAKEFDDAVIYTGWYTDLEKEDAKTLFRHPQFCRLLQLLQSFRLYEEDAYKLQGKPVGECLYDRVVKLVAENLRFYDDFAQYLGNIKTGHVAEQKWQAYDRHRDITWNQIKLFDRKIRRLMREDDIEKAMVYETYWNSFKGLFKGFYKTSIKKLNQNADSFLLRTLTKEVIDN